MYPSFAQNTSASTSPDDDIPVRPTRKQVSRACDWCRARRIKCDNGRPCRACRQRGAQCTHKGTDEPRTLPQAMREIDKLKAQIKELESDLSASRSRSCMALPTPSDTTATSPSSTRDVRQSSQAGSITASPSSSTYVATVSKPQWMGIHAATSRFDHQVSYYGPSSHFYFLHRIGAHLDKTLHFPHPARSMQPSGEARRRGAFIDVEDGDEKTDRTYPLHGSSLKKELMTRTQEEYFIGVFWESYHALVPIIDEVDFRVHYASLWDPSRPTRRHSALVDMVLAICLQYGYTLIPRTSERQPGCPDATMAGKQYYHRAQALIVPDLESPTLATVQALIFSVGFLCCASFHNMSHLAMAQATRMAQIVGLHLEPPEHLPLAEKELRKRVWWALFNFEAKTSMKLGRPMASSRSMAPVSLPSDSIEVASANGATLGSFGDATWLTYPVHMYKLTSTTADIHNTINDKFGFLLQANKIPTPYEDPRLLETCAECLGSMIPSIKAWADQVPSSLKTPRRGGGEPFSLDRTPLELDSLTPPWLARQRICAEMTYHSQMSILTRPFIVFNHDVTTYTPVAERLASTSVNHAISHILIMHQTIFETDFLSGWTEYFFWHWNAVLTVTGFILAYPIHPSTPTARQALEKGIAVFDRYSQEFAIAADTAKITRNLMASADLLVSRLRDGTQRADSPVVELPMREPTDGGIQLLNPPDDSLSWLDPSQQSDPAFVNEFMDWAFSVDQFNSSERFFDTDISVEI